MHMKKSFNKINPQTFLMTKSWVVISRLNETESCSGDGMEESVVLSGLKKFNNCTSPGF